jgi:enoyl-CoA hydratase/carnithine racemase
MRQIFPYVAVVALNWNKENWRYAMTELVRRNDEGGIATLTLNRPEALNALSPSLFVTLRGHLEDISSDFDNIGCVILAGEGRSFCAGNDLRAIQAGEEAPTPEYQAETVELFANLPQPTIVAVQGHCYTGGLELALAGDLLIAADTARFADTHGKWAMTPRWGMSQRLPRRIGPLAAKEMMFTGRVVSGEEAAQIGLANRCVPAAELASVTLTLAQQIVENSWHSLRGNKMLVDGGAGLQTADAIAFEKEHSPGRGPDSAERIKRFGG